MTLALLTQPETYVSLLTLTAMEVVLGIDTLRRTCRGTRTNRATTGDDGAPGYRTELLTRCTQRGTERGVTCGFCRKFSFGTHLGYDLPPR
jgi:hypothetical protein